MMEWKVRLCARVIYTILTSMYNEMMMQKSQMQLPLVLTLTPNIHRRPPFWTIVHKVNN